MLSAVEHPLCCIRVHRAKDSYLSWGSGFQHFEGVMNWAFLMLAIGGIRLFLENFNK